MTDTQIPPAIDPETEQPSRSILAELLGRISRLEIVVAAVIAAVMLALVVLEPDILEAPFENERTLLFTLGGTALAAIAFVAMLWFRVPSFVRVVVLVVPFALVNWWLISPYFIDDVVDESFETSISAQLADPVQVPADPGEPVTVDPQPADDAPSPAADTPAVATEPQPETAPQNAEETPAPAAEAEGADAPPADEPVVDEAPVAEEEPPPPPAPTGPVLLGAGQFVGLAGHSGTGDAGIFQNPDGSYTLRFENFDIENGPDLEVYLVPGADQTDLADGSIHLGALKGNIGDQNYELDASAGLVPGATYTALVWCEAFSVEFVGATIVI